MKIYVHDVDFRIRYNLSKISSTELELSRYSKGFPGDTVVKDSTYQCKRCRLDCWVGKIPLEEGMATHSSILAWKIPWTEEPGGVQSMGSQRAGQD